MDSDVPNQLSGVRNNQIRQPSLLVGSSTNWPRKLSCRRVPGSPRQLVYRDRNGALRLDTETAQRCFGDSRIADHSLCLISVIGEKRCGKSFLMNYIVRALYNQERGMAILGDQNERLTGFQWQNGDDVVTEGIWIWDRPFILERNGEKMAVFVLDTEGSLDLELNPETSHKLSALSMFLSSYQIFNINKSLKRTELDLLEIYDLIQDCIPPTAGPAGGAMTRFKMLDLLVRDYNDPGNCGREAGQDYLSREIRKLERRRQREKMINSLRNQSLRSFLIPHPGNRFLSSRDGNLAVMDEDFRRHFITYIRDLLATTWRHPRTNAKGDHIKCGDLIQDLQEFMNLLNTQQFNFSSTPQMYRSMQNAINRNNIIKKLEDFLEKEDPPLHKVLINLPPAMKSKIKAEIKSLLSEYGGLLLTDSEEEKTRLMDGLETELKNRQKRYCSYYKKMYAAMVVGAAGATVVAGFVIVKRLLRQVPYKEHPWWDTTMALWNSLPVVIENSVEESERERSNSYIVIIVNAQSFQKIHDFIPINHRSSRIISDTVGTNGKHPPGN
ncbi:RING finger protein 112-like [Dendropsophus ebraccatus]|uniref:RING finger protein 112-like n=1 Tax=Dendropsophus ebraccatus TaxID=150705 RepID=UPI003831C9BD